MPNYQRGYRWTSSQVEALLNDIWDSSERKEDTYCLQPIVIMTYNRGYALIDGQQRFTTILILLNYIKRRGLPIDIKFELDYVTRGKTKEFIENINEKEAQSNIDFYHIYEADRTIDNWLNKKFDGDFNKITYSLFTLINFLLKSVKVIWYEVDYNEDPIALFTRLNIGKIGLTNAELIRALLLRRVPNDPDRDKKQIEMSCFASIAINCFISP